MDAGVQRRRPFRSPERRGARNLASIVLRLRPREGHRPAGTVRRLRRRGGQGRRRRHLPHLRGRVYATLHRRPAGGGGFIARRRGSTRARRRRNVSGRRGAPAPPTAGNSKDPPRTGQGLRQGDGTGRRSPSSSTGTGTTTSASWSWSRRPSRTGSSSRGPATSTICSSAFFPAGRVRNFREVQDALRAIDGIQADLGDPRVGAWHPAEYPREAGRCPAGDGKNRYEYVGEGGAGHAMRQDHEECPPRSKKRVLPSDPRWTGMRRPRSRESALADSLRTVRAERGSPSMGAEAEDAARPRSRRERRDRAQEDLRQRDADLRRPAMFPGAIRN